MTIYIMQTTLLSTKLYVPPMRETLVARPRLTASLSNALKAGLTLISAPAGYGKTTLVSSWLRETATPCAWLSLEESDNDPIRFLQYLLTALQGVVPAIHVDLLEMVEGVQPASFQALMNILINEITKSNPPFVLVMDDFHLIQDQSILDIVAFLLEHLPSQHMHLMLLTRIDPPLSLSRMRVRNQLVEIRADQLRFTLEEVTEFVNGVMGFNLSKEDISAMNSRTEGWIAGLQLAGLSMQDCKDRSGFIAAFSGSHHYIVDYLTEEVLKQQDEITRQFLLQTSILPRMCASLCDSIIEIEEAKQAGTGQTMLENLQKKNLFIIPLDEERRWYRYHQLFADALSRRLENQYSQLLPTLYQRASRWYENNGLIGEAIQSALNAGDQERIANLVEQNGCYLLMSGEVLTLIKWMQGLETYFLSHPMLVIQKGWALTLAGSMEPAEQVFRSAESLVASLEPSTDVDTMVGTISAGRAYWAEIQGNIGETARLARQALELLPDTDPLSQSMRSVATSALAKTLFLSGDLDGALQIYYQALDIGKSADNLEMIINTQGDICDILSEQGKLRQAERILSDTLPLAFRADGRRLPLSAWIYSGLSSIYYEWNQQQRAEHFAKECIDVSQEWGDAEEQAVGMILLAKVEQARGNLKKAIELTKAVDQLKRDDHLYPKTTIRIETALNQYWLSIGSQERVSRYLTDNAINLSGEISFLVEPRYFILLRWLLASGKFEAALGLAQRLYQIADGSLRTFRAVEALILQSLAYLGMKDMSSAGNSLSKAVLLAQPEGYKRVFLDEGEGIRKLLFQVKSIQSVGGYVNELLEAFGPASEPALLSLQLLFEPLSSREIEVLKLIEAGLSNQEIGSKLFISMGTVKRHISNIYSKLDVKNRTQAIARGKELGFFEAWP